MTRDEDEVRELFAERYHVRRQDLHRTIERTVIGSDWGATGYTTREQADQLRRLVGLRADHTLLDLGSGRGWPGLYFAASTGCRVICIDLPVEGLAEARARAQAEGLDQQVTFAVASAQAPPVPPKSVDAIIASDVFC